MQPIVFLDVDGVLNSAAWFDTRGPRPPDRPLFDHNIDPATVTRLNRLCSATNAGIVVSSTWRFGATVAELRLDFQRVGCTAPIIGKTPERGRGPRCDEIALWLVRRVLPLPAFVILDDDADMFVLTPRLVRIDHAVGLTDADVERAIALLQGTAA